VDAQEEIVRLLAIQLRRSVESQAQAIDELSRAGFKPTRIAELLGTTPNTVNVQLAKKKKATRTRGG
jgi:hypothetical protein